MYDSELAFTGPTGLALGGYAIGGSTLTLISMVLMFVGLLLLILAVRARLAQHRP